MGLTSPDVGSWEKLSQRVSAIRRGHLSRAKLQDLNQQIRDYDRRAEQFAREAAAQIDLGSVSAPPFLFGRRSLGE
jgi:hypothetical protein